MLLTFLVDLEYQNVFFIGKINTVFYLFSGGPENVRIYALYAHAVIFIALALPGLT